MAKYLVGVFEDEEHVLDATLACRVAGFKFHDVYAPYAVHGLDRAMGLRRSRLTWVCFICGMSAVAFACWFQNWTFITDWPINIGGKEQAAEGAYMPLMFEFGVLIAGLSTVTALFMRSRLYPGRKEKLIVPRVTDDRFAIALVQPEGFDRDKAEAIFREFHAEEILELGDGPRP